MTYVTCSYSLERFISSLLSNQQVCDGFFEKNMLKTIRLHNTIKLYLNKKFKELQHAGQLRYRSVISRIFLVTVSFVYDSRVYKFPFPRVWCFRNFSSILFSIQSSPGASFNCKGLYKLSMSTGFSHSIPKFSLCFRNTSIISRHCLMQQTVSS